MKEIVIPKEIKEILDQYRVMDLTEGQQLQVEAQELVVSFRGFDAPNYSKEEYETLLEKMRSYEQRTIHLDILNYLYGDMARVALNAKNLELAVSYAKAGLELCKSDPEGQWANLMNLCDTSMTKGSATVAAEYFEKANPGQSFPFTEKEDAETVKSVSDFIQNVPDKTISFRYMKDENTKREEESRRLMLLAGNPIHEV
jgi:hypothetical protein